MRSLPPVPCWALPLLATLLPGPLIAQAQTSPDPAPARKAHEVQSRGGLPHFFEKAVSGGEVRVAYLGGSITAQPGYRVRTLQHFAREFPKAQWSEINAAIGGTGSDLGVFRIDHDVFAGSPDLLFVEFAVNDSGADPREITKSMEGIVRKTWKRFPNCDICFVYTFTEALLPELRTGFLNRSAAAMETVADHYGIPTIHMGLEAVRLETEGKLLMKAPEAKVERVSGDELNRQAPIAVGSDGKIPFSLDGVHPYVDTGHRLYTEAVIRSLPTIRAAGGDPSAPHHLPTPLQSDNYEQTVMLPMDRTTRRGPWSRLPTDQGLGKSFSKRVDSLWKAEPSAELTFHFRGSQAKIYDLVGPDGGKLEVTVDGQPSQRVRFDPYCTYHRLATTLVAKELDPNAVHEVRIRVTDEAVDKAKILFEKNRADLLKYPDKYAPTVWYSGAVFLVGELLP